jgi:Mlc titration factor MtfA (ptsG expression regulator)
VLRPYGAQDEIELFAVAVEEFFVRPAPLREFHPALYAALVDHLRQDPLAGTR